MKLRIRTHLDYQFTEPTDILLQIEAAAIPEQAIDSAWIDISPCDHFARVAAQDLIGERIWLRADGRFTVDYTATVAINRRLDDCGALAKVPPHQLPGETVQYLMASRYCPSDEFQTFVDAEFGDLDGGAFDKTGVLVAPLELPNVLLLPSAAFRGLPAIRSDVDKTKRTFACHTRPGKAEKGTQCTGDAICADAKCFPFVGGRLPSASAPRPERDV